MKTTFKNTFLSTAKSLGYLKNNFSVYKFEGRWVVETILNDSSAGKRQIEEVFSKMGLTHKLVEVPTMFAGVKSLAFKPEYIYNA